MKEFHLVNWTERRAMVVEAEEYPTRLVSQGWEVADEGLFLGLDAAWQYEALQRKAEAFAKRYGKEYHTPAEYQTSDEENVYTYRHYINRVADDLAEEVARLHEAIAEMQADIETLEEQLEDACYLVYRADDCLEAMDASPARPSEE